MNCCLCHSSAARQPRAGVEGVVGRDRAGSAQIFLANLFAQPEQSQEFWAVSRARRREGWSRPSRSRPSSPNSPGSPRFQGRHAKWRPAHGRIGWLEPVLKGLTGDGDECRRGAPRVPFKLQSRTGRCCMQAARRGSRDSRRQRATPRGSAVHPNKRCVRPNALRIIQP